MSSVIRIHQPHLFLLGDVHGRGEEVAQLLAARGLSAGSLWCGSPEQALVQVGDLIDFAAFPAVDAEEKLGPLLQLAADRHLGESDLLLPGLAGDSEYGLRDLLAGRVAFSQALQQQERVALYGALQSLATLRLFRRWDTAAVASSDRGRVCCLLGNHDLDLLRGRFLYARRQKCFLMALCGVPLREVLRHAAHGLPCAEWVHSSPELEWLHALPMVAIAGSTLLVHGGPPRAWVASMEVLGIDGPDGLASYLDAARAEGFEHPAFAEGLSLFSPDAPDDDWLRLPAPAARFLERMGVAQMAVGHSPFLHFPKGRWQDLNQDEVRFKIDRPARLGTQVEIIKLDTNLKRAGLLWLVERRPSAEGSQSWWAWRPEEEVALPPAEVDGAAQGLSTEVQLPEEGMDGDDYMALLGALEALEGEETQAVRDALEADFGRFIAVGATDLLPLLAAARLARKKGLAALDGVEMFLAVAEQRYAAMWAAVARADRPRRGVLLLPGLEACTVQGRLLLVAARVAQDYCQGAGAAALARGPVLTVTCHQREGEAWMKASLFGPKRAPEEALRPIATWPPDRESMQAMALALGEGCAEVEGWSVVEGLESVEAGVGAALRQAGAQRREGARWEREAVEKLGPTARVRLGPAVEAAAVLGRLARWAEANGLGDAVGSGGLRQAATVSGAVMADRYIVEACAGTFLVLDLPDGVVVPANTAFVAPEARFTVQGRGGAVSHAAYLLSHLPDTRVRLYSAVTESVAALLATQEFERLGLAAVQGPGWRRGRYLFTTPYPDVLRYFYNKDLRLSFAVPRAALSSALHAGLVNINLFLSDQGEDLAGSPALGGADVGLEVVALGADGIAWLWEHREA